MAYISFLNEFKMVESKMKQESILKQITSYLPILTIGIIFLSLLKQFLYYFHFSVPIKYFISITELGLLISDDIILLIASCYFILIPVFIWSKNLAKRENLKPEKKEKIISSAEKLKRYDRTEKWLKFISILIIFIIVFFMFYFHKYTTNLILLAGLLFALFFSYLCFQIDDIFDSTKADIGVYSIVGLLGIIGLILCYTSTDIIMVEDGRYKGTIIKTTDSTYVSTDSSYFIGKTEKYVFIYNKKDTATSIIPTESIKSIKLKSFY